MSIMETDCPRAMDICPQSTCASANRSRPDKFWARWDRPAARPDHTCTTKRGSEAKQSIRRGSCVPERDSTAAFEFPLLDVLHLHRFLAECLLRQRCFHELIEIAEKGIRQGSGAGGGRRVEEIV